MGWARPIFFREKGWAKREFHDDWGCYHRIFLQVHKFVDKKLVMNYIEHLSQLQSVNEIRKQEPRKEFSKFEPSKMYIAMTGKHL